MECFKLIDILLISVLEFDVFDLEGCNSLFVDPFGEPPFHFFTPFSRLIGVQSKEAVFLALRVSELPSPFLGAKKPSLIRFDVDVDQLY